MLNNARMPSLQDKLAEQVKAEEEKSRAEEAAEEKPKRRKLKVEPKLGKSRKKK